MKTTFASIVLTALLFVGCATTQTPVNFGPAITQTTVMAGASYEMTQDANLRPYLMAAAPVICNAAGSGKIDPAAIVADLQASSANELKTTNAAIVINLLLGIYETIYYSYGTNIQASVVQPYLQAVCNGLNAALGASPSNLAAMARNRIETFATEPRNWPHVK